MSTQVFFLLALTGILAGILSGFVGVGGGVIIVPALIYVIGMSERAAFGTSLFILLLPVGILAVMNYYKQGYINWKFGLVVALTFVVGGYVGSKLALKVSPNIVKIVFGVVMAYVSFKMISSGVIGVRNE